MHSGYISFKDRNSSSKPPYLKMDYARSRFRHYIELAYIDQVYDISDESYQSHVPRRLHRLTTHIPRHYAITSFSKQTNGNIVLTRKFARHSKSDTTITDINIRKEGPYVGLNNLPMDVVERLRRSIISK